jgi:glucosamine--fructose-6-phosphate aminotransferase (isomerizing)
MCGLFGAIRCADQSHAALVFDVVLALGNESEERGKDSSGLAMIVADTYDRRKYTLPTRKNVSAPVMGLDKTFVIKEAKPFSQLDFSSYYEVVSTPNVFVGHTRSATQGNTKDLVNASPMLIGGLIATHNGDIDIDSVPNHSAYQKESFGGTDSEVMFRALDNSRNDRRALTKILRSVEGRAAVVFYDRSRPYRLYLARAALSPLAYTYDESGNFYYASNPDWFRRVADENPLVKFGEIVMVPEGHLLTVNTLTGVIEDVRRFTPITRENDVRIMNFSAYRGFKKEDKTVDLGLHRHKVVQEKLKSWPNFTAVPNDWDKFYADAEKEYKKKNKIKSNVEEEQIKDTSIDSRLAAEEPEIWDDSMYFDDVDGEIMARYEAIDLDEIEDLCWASGKFDHYSFEKILTAAPSEALNLVKELREEAGIKKYQQNRLAKN